MVILYKKPAKPHRTKTTPCGFINVKTLLSGLRCCFVKKPHRTAPSSPLAETHAPQDTIMAELPMEILLLNILPILPAKSILCFKFVCKQWHSHLTTPAFAKIHLHHLTNINHHQNHHKLLVVSVSKSNPTKFCTMDCETPKDPLTATRLVPFEASYQTMSIVTSFHGMLCVGISDKCSQGYDVEYSHLILWNPLMGDYKTLSKAGSDNKCYKRFRGPFGLYYNSSDDDYKLLRVTGLHAAYIYSLKSDSWRKVVEETFSFEPQIYNWFSKSWEPSVLLNNEKPPFLKQSTLGNCVRNTYSILMFDTKTENFTAITTPSFENRLTTCSSFMVHGDPPQIHLCVTIHTRYPSIFSDSVLWRMDGDGEWTKVLSYRPMSWSLSFRHPLHQMRNGNWLMHSFYPRIGLVELDMEKQTKEVVSPNINRGIYIPERGKYMETIVSPNQYTN